MDQPINSSHDSSKSISPLLSLKTLRILKQMRYIVAQAYLMPNRPRMSKNVALLLVGPTVMRTVVYEAIRSLSLAPNRLGIQPQPTIKAKNKLLQVFIRKCETQSMNIFTSLSINNNISVISDRLFKTFISSPQ